MLALPLPILTFVLSAVACVLVWRLDIGNRLARMFFTGAFGLIALGTLLIGLRFGYGVERFIVIQRVIPLFIGPIIYLGFLALSQPVEAVRKRLPYHLGVALIAALIPQLFPMFRSGFDLVIGLSYLGYCVALLLLWGKGPDSLAFASLGMVAGLRKWMLCAAGLLGVMLVFDSVIALSFAMQRLDYAVQLISIGSAVSMLSVIIAIIVFSRGSKEAPASRNAKQSAGDSQVKLEQVARELLADNQLYLDTELTLERLSKRLHVPARALSEAINKTQNMNVSQYVNGFRLDHAANLLENSDMSVVRVMEQSGFLTRSNFYREFERVYGKSPIEYRRQTSAK